MLAKSTHESQYKKIIRKLKHSFLIKALSYLAFFIPTKLLIKYSGKKIIYPFYHIISDNPPPHIKHLYPIRTTKQFEKDLDFLQKYFSASAFPGNSKETQFILSFDDGLSEVYTSIAPILKKRNIPAVFFINSGFTDNKDLFFRYKISLIIEALTKGKSARHICKSIKCKTKKECRKKLLSLKYSAVEQIHRIADIAGINFREYLKKEQAYLTVSQIEDLKRQGFQIGAHSESHPLFSEIDEERQIAETAKSIDFVIRTFKEQKKLFAFPFSDAGVKDSFFKRIFDENRADFTFGTAGIKDDTIKRNIQRIPIEKYGFSAKKHIKTELLMYILKRFINKHKVKR